MAAIGAFEARESRGKITAAEEGFDGCDGSRFEQTEYRSVLLFVISRKGTPAVIDKLPKRRGPGATGLVDGWHEIRSYEHIPCVARMGVMDRFCGKSRYGYKRW